MPDFYISVPCRRCVNCISSYMTSWRNRLFYEFEYMSSEARANSYFVTLTFRDSVLKDKDFDVYKCKKRFIDRIRKKVGSSPRYWFVTEYGERFGRLHLHGIFFDCNFDIHELEDLWTYGFVDFSLLTENSIKYCTSYITKGNDEIIIPPSKVQRVFCSPGIGKAYCDDKYNISYHHPSPGVLNPVLQNSSQFLQSMPRYFRNKIFTDFEREDMTFQYFDELSDDTIPEPPYCIGKTKFTDYTRFISACKPHITRYKQLYFPKLNYHGK